MILLGETQGKASSNACIYTALLNASGITHSLGRECFEAGTLIRCRECWYAD